MKFQILFIILICANMILPSIAWYPSIFKAQTAAKPPYHLPASHKKIDRNGQFLPYHGYTIIARINDQLMRVAQQIEQFIQISNSRESYSPLPAHTYHMSIYTIFSNGNKLIKPIKEWVKKSGRTVPNRGWLPVDVLEKQNRKALCILRKYLKEPLNIKYASLKIGDTVLSLSLELREESLRRINEARKQLKKVYEHSNKSMEPINKKLHITLAYVYGNKRPLYLDDWNRLNELVRSFNGAKLSIPYLYLFESMTKYYEYETSYLDCRVYNFWQ